MEANDTVSVKIINSPYSTTLEIPKVDPTFRQLSEQIQIIFDVDNFKLLYMDEEKDWITFSTDLELQDVVKRWKNITFYLVKQEDPNILRVMTYNISGYKTPSPWKDRLKRIVAHIQEVNPDVISFQGLQANAALNESLMKRVLSMSFSMKKHANEWTAGKSMLADLQNALPEYLHIKWTQLLQFSKGYMEGSAIFSKYPIDSTTKASLGLYNSSLEEQCTSSKILHPVHDVQLFNAKMLTQKPADKTNAAFHIWEKAQSEFDANVPQIITLTSQIEGESDAATDFLTGKSELHETRGEFLDVWKEVNGDDEFEGYTHPSWEPKNRQDRIFYREDLKPVRADISGHCENVIASCSCFLYVDFEIM